MCGILGYIGRSTNPQVSFELANSLLIKTESRGEHATGFWGCEYEDGRIFFDKEPVKSSIYVHRDIWKNGFQSVNSDLLIAHCRYTSMNVGHEKFNKNNHPHASSDRRVALVHNGKIPEYTILKSRYDLRSDCDSEILLGMFESSDSYKNAEQLKTEFPNQASDVACRLMGLREVFSRVNFGAMAVAVGERGDDTRSRYLWLFRDDERPLHVVDMRKTLGQIFFCSTPEIWRGAVDATPSVKPYIPSNQQIIEFPSFHVWMLALSPNQEPEVTAWEQLQKEVGEDDKQKYATMRDVPKDVWDEAVSANQMQWRLKKFKVTKTKFYDWDPKSEPPEKLPRMKGKPDNKVITRLAADEELKGVQVPISSKKKITPTTVSDALVLSSEETASLDDTDNRTERSGVDDAVSDLSPVETGINMIEFENLVAEVKRVLLDVETQVQTRHRENSITRADLSAVMDSLKDAKNELEGSILFLR